MNPFTERTRITDPARFTGRWRELGTIFERLESRRPTLVIGVPGAGKSSLLTHIHQAAPSVLELPDLASFFLDLAVLPDAATVYRLLTRAMGFRGDTLAELEAALARLRRPVLICLDGADAALEAGWGEQLLERLARLARRSLPFDPDGLAPPDASRFDLMLVAAAGAVAPTLSEPFAVVPMRALASSEVRLLTEAYLDETGVEFSGAELNELAALSVGHPAYLQRAAYHLFKAKTQPGYNWRAAYLAEAREQPVPGAPLPPAVFRGEGEDAFTTTDGTAPEAGGARTAPELMSTSGGGELFEAILPVVAALIALQAGLGWAVALLVLVTGYGLVALLLRRKRL